MSKRWATPTWYFLHMLIEKIDANHYQNINKEYIDLMVNLFNNLPCPYCKTHAIAYTKKNNIYNMTTKAKMKQYMFHFHNDVNKRIGTKIHDNKIFALYERMNTIKVSNYFIKHFFMSNTLAKNFNGWQSTLKYDIITFLNKHKDKFRG